MDVLNQLSKLANVDLDLTIEDLKSSKTENASNDSLYMPKSKQRKQRGHHVGTQNAVWQAIRETLQEYAPSNIKQLFSKAMFK